MIILSAIIGIIAGIVLTILTEIVKKANQRRNVASKLFADAILTMGDILESDRLLTLAANAKTIYSDNNVEACQKRLDSHLNSMRVEMQKEDGKLPTYFDSIITDKLSTERHIYLGEIIEEKYRKGTLLLTDEERAILPPRIQAMVTEMIEHYFQVHVAMRYFVERLNQKEFNRDHAIEDYIEISKNMIKYYKDRDKIMKYAKEVSGKSLLRSLLCEFRLQNF
jgi:hypothetical protein